LRADAVKFADAASAAAAVARANGLVVSGHTLRVDSASRGKAGCGEAFDAKRSVFLGNLPTKVTEEAVRKHFEAGLHSALLKIGGLRANAEVSRDGGSGEELEKPLIEGVRVIRDPVTQVGKGFGYVLLRDRAAAAAALALHGSKLNGRELRVQVHTTLGNAQV
jgi:RNA recognition motif-containing protein